MYALGMILFMGLIGSLIGGFTNFIAIKMLFRPFEPKFLFGKQLPFTPGLIPKRRNELSLKIGEMVTHHLLTPEVFKEKLMTPQTEQLLKRMLNKQVQDLKEGQYSIDDFAQRFNIDITNVAESKVHNKVDQLLQEKIETYQSESIEALLPQGLKDKIDSKVEGAPELIIEKLRAYVNSESGYNDIMQMIDRFFMEKGRLVSMIQMFMTQEMIAERVIKEANALSEEPKIRSIIETELKKEYARIMAMTPESLVAAQDITRFKEELNSNIVRAMHIDHYMKTPLYTLVPQAFQYVEAEGGDRLIHYVMTKTADNIAVILEKIHIAEIIKDQIDNFELSFLEKLVIEISSKELKLITLLGFLLGGIIGVFQGIIAIFV
ncbi:DUF445 domain-containing protein [Macrococcoides canis]|uniref:DUF445 domain-containing protein n=2 Tax=Macrococcoides canis TaxID=1855823 RepID=UPI0013E8FFAD|nr:DUF445 family protein [Macrococcus canis]QIH76535.1 DUF445 family protein [Macrococcus canis]UTH08682.1 DUF445 domain-containing protein [Macrococcus canis]WBF53382.1 DUF445 family protein [Macrococcus canis]